MASAPASGEGVESRDPGDGEGQGSGKGRRKARRPRPSPSQLSAEEAFERALASALRLLDHRERSRVELRSRLKQKGFDADTVEGVLERLRERGLQSDERFAESFTSDAHRSRGLSTLAVQGELRRRGIDGRLAAEAATERPEDEEARARALAQKRAARLGALPPEIRRRRLLGFLARRGYPAELSRRIVAETTDMPAGTGRADTPGEPEADRLP